MKIDRGLLREIAYWLCLALVCVLIFLVTSCAAPRVAPVGYFQENPQKPGQYLMNPDLPQPDPAEYVPGAPAQGILGMLGAALPQPWGSLVTLLSGLGIGEYRRRKEREAHGQTIAGIDEARKALPENAQELLCTALASKQDTATQRLVWNMRP